MYTITIRAPGAPSQAVLERALEALTQANCQWYLDQWSAGKEPPCCAGCGDVRWRPDRASYGPVELLDAPTVFDRKVASCHSIAAISAGHGRAKALLEGWPTEMAGQHRVTLQEQAPAYWHALYEHPGGWKDPTANLEVA